MTFTRKIGMKAEHAAPYGKPDAVNDTLSQRAQTHGCFIENGRIMQALKDEIANSVNWPTLSPHQKEALQMIQHKVGRILSGDANEPDHWKDIAGYSMLVHNILVYGKSHV
jgi:hypothetical protein